MSEAKSLSNRTLTPNEPLDITQTNQGSNNKNDNKIKESELANKPMKNNHAFLKIFKDIADNFKKKKSKVNDITTTKIITPDPLQPQQQAEVLQNKNNEINLVAQGDIEVVQVFAASNDSLSNFLDDQDDELDLKSYTNLDDLVELKDQSRARAEQSTSQKKSPLLEEYNYFYTWIQEFSPVKSVELYNTILKDAFMEKSLNKKEVFDRNKRKLFLSYALLQKPPSIAELLLALAEIYTLYTYEKYCISYFKEDFSELILLYLNGKKINGYTWENHKGKTEFWATSNRVYLGSLINNIALKMTVLFFSNGKLCDYDKEIFLKENAEKHIIQFSRSEDDLGHKGDFIMWLYWFSARLGFYPASHFCLKTIYWNYMGSNTHQELLSFSQYSYEKNLQQLYKQSFIQSLSHKYINFLKNMTTLSYLSHKRLKKKGGLLKQLSTEQIRFERNLFFNDVPTPEKGERDNENPAHSQSPYFLTENKINAIETVDYEEDKEHKEYKASYEALKNLERTDFSKLDYITIQETLTQEFPWFKKAIEECMIMLKIQNRLSNYVLYGAPGCGKSYFLQRLAELIQAQYHLYSLSGSADNRVLQGTGRGWGTATPALPVQIMVKKKCINPFILVDELDKHTPGNNGNCYNTLNNLLEPTTAKKCFDECLLTTVNVSEINWLFTANTLQDIPFYLMSRLEGIYCEKPKKSDLELVLNNLKIKWMKDKKAERLVDKLTINPFLYERYLRDEHTSIKQSIDLDLRIVQKGVNKILYKQLKEVLNINS